MQTEQTIHALWPQARTPVLLHGLYLDENLYAPDTGATPYIYANYVSSIDGRIAIADSPGNPQTPAHLKSSADWSLFKELQAQAECLITHSGYLRALASGTLGDILRIPDGDENQYLHRWRAQNGLKQQPAILILSRTLDFPWPPSLDASTRQVHVLTVRSADQDKIAALRDRGVSVLGVETDDLICARRRPLNPA